MPRTAQFIKNLSRFRLITFDVTDTLLRFRKAPAVQYAKTAAELGVQDIDQEKLQECFRLEFKNMYKKYPNFGSKSTEITWQEWWIQLVENIFWCVDDKIPPEKLRLVAETLLKIYRTKECWSHCEGSKELVSKVKETNKLMGIISNFDPSLSKILSAMDFEYFDLIVTSYEAGIQKPNAEIFEIAAERCCVRAQEALHIGNIYEIDYVGAKNAGWSSILVTKDAEQHAAKAKHVFTSMTKLQDALETQDFKW